MSIVERSTSFADLDEAALEAALRDEVEGEVRFDAGSRGAYATDGSNYRQVPIGVVVPYNIDAGATAVAVCARFGAPVLSRGGGTSLGGQCTNTAVVIDWTKYCDNLVSVDPEARTCIVEPGIVLDELNRQLAACGLKFGPKPSTHSHCTLGGMIGNNSCGASAQAYGKTVDNVRRMEILTYDGVRCWVGPTSTEEYDAITALGDRRAELYAGMRNITDQYLGEIRRGYPQIPRRVSGYNLDDLLPEKGFNVARGLVGSEGTLVTVLRAELELVPVPAADAMLILGYPDICAAADDVSRILEHSDPAQLEALDDRMAQLMREEGSHLESLRTFPEGGSWLLMQFTGDDQDEADRQAHDLLRALKKSTDDPNVALSDDSEREQRMLRAREAGLGVTARPPDGRETWEGWEDSAVPPERLGDYLRDLKKLFDRFDYDHPSLYGHFGQGCVHTRIPFGLRTAEGVAHFHEFLQQAADLVVSYGGSLSGEHGDGQARGELLPKMFGDPLVTAFGKLKALFDPDDRMNPGKVVAPHRADENLRLGPEWRPRDDSDARFGYPEDDHSFNQAVMRCVGIGNCRTHQGGVMCPSYRATGEEEHSTRGRARLLFEMIGGHKDSPVSDGWRSKEVKDALDLCLACKGCKSDCPVGVDMATYKAEFLSHHYEGRLRPLAHYALGWLPLWARAAQIAPRAVNTLLHAPGIAALGKRLAGVADRDAPLFAPQSFTQWWQDRNMPEPDPSDPRTVVIWPDTFSTYFHPSVARSAVRVLEDAGFHVAVPQQSVCCGLTWISTGQLGAAERILKRTVQVLRPWIEAGTPIVGLEPSCTAVFRADAPELMPDDQDIQRLSGQFLTFSELLLNHAPDGWSPPSLTRAATVQTHCHQHAVTKFDADRELMRRAGIDADVLDEGCCGLAGNFGFERGHGELSMAIGELGVLPAVREAAPSAMVIADGFSCRTQIEQGGTGRRALHLAEVLAIGLDGPAPADHPEKAADRPPEPSALRTRLTTAGVALAAAGSTAGGAYLALRKLRR
ncbi:FAD-binding and (Fe-S)-binding domain-containing protein [Actinacidiphila acidipaludis]|uniref:FAD-binding protein n=1 Tax=Actinacidiphila acidipaludis TaxID=2873382 RepID=A0ABS7QGF3_9ACTN|nr:FAD-binding and (Fe-S)-binding domain-containing protein [Streptomyces acidipaludis]MBY8882245.1 FAD-binding protein [Streptomyces acidipaludis]